MLVLLMSAVPVALPVMFTVSMAVGSKELAKRGVLVTRPERCGGRRDMNVLCVDQTGTITMNQFHRHRRDPAGAGNQSDVLFAGALASQAANQDPIDLALLGAAQDRHIFNDKVPAVTPVSFRAVRREKPAHRSRGRAGRAATARHEGRRSNQLACGLEPAAIKALEEFVGEAARNGYRKSRSRAAQKTVYQAWWGW